MVTKNNGSPKKLFATRIAACLILSSAWTTTAAAKYRNHHVRSTHHVSAFHGIPILPHKYSPHRRTATINDNYACTASSLSRRTKQWISISTRKHPSHPLTLSSSSSIEKDNDEDEEGDAEIAVKYGRKSYWNAMYDGKGNRNAKEYAWYCGWDEFAPFWHDLITSKDARVLVPGTGNDFTPVDMYDAGWTNMTAFDYSKAGVDRARELFGNRSGVQLLHADARDLPLPTASFNATLDKGALDAIYIAGRPAFQSAVQELTRVMAPNGIVVSVSRVVLPEELIGAFDSPQWEMLHDGSLAFASEGGTTIDLGADLYAWRRTEEL